MTGIADTAGGANVEIAVRDSTPFHVFQPGKRFSFEIATTTTAGRSTHGIAYQWRDFRGNPLGPVIAIESGSVTTVNSPSAVPQAGYLGLALLVDDPDVTINAKSGSRAEVGFAVLPRDTAADRILAPQSPFGVIHANTEDPYIPTWIKTLTWNTTAPGSWKSEMDRRRAAGFMELPLVSGKGWVSDDQNPVSEVFLGELQKKFLAYISADPSIRHWELGREENLNRRYEQTSYFANLEAKAVAIRNVSRAVAPDLRLLFQIGGRSMADTRAFLGSQAVDDFDILAPHPYFWPDFPAPEKWLESFIDDRRRAMLKLDVDLPMWFTEIGAPQNDAGVLQMLSGDKPVRGQGRDEHAAYLVKTHVISLANGIEKIFWYNYIDRDPSTTDVEDHFGLIDYWGFPKPSYAAYINMLRCLRGKRFRNERNVQSDIRAYEFAAGGERCIVTWVYPASAKTVAIDSIVPGLKSDDLVAATNTVGTTLDGSASLSIDGFPIFLTVRGEAAP